MKGSKLLYGKLLGLLVVLAAAACALWLRLAHLGCAPFCVDEAESAINALTILEHGYPADRYLGLPLYENTLIEPWPESEEYEFKDTSYSSRGVTVYHGWLPLYAMAAAFAAAGIGPDEETTRLEVKHSLEEVSFRTAAARFPSALFGIVLLFLLYRGGRKIGDGDVALAALLIGAFAEPLIKPARLARYPSASLTLGAASGLMIWLMAQRGRWSHFIAGGLLLALLFHTHIVSFVVVLATGVFMLPSLCRHRHAFYKLAATGLIAVAGTLPWVLLAGFHEKPSGIPMAWSLLSFPGDLFSPLLASRRVSIVVGLAIILFPLLRLSRRMLPEPWTRPFFARRQAHYFLSVWLASGYVASSFLHPAASYWLGRIYNCLLPPGILLVAMAVASAARVLFPDSSGGKSARLLVAFLALVVLWATQEGTLSIPNPRPVCRRAPEEVSIYEMVEHLRRRRLEPGTRIYATPNSHLILMAYTGLPVQSIAPVRKSFLDAWEKPILILECIKRFPNLPREEVRRIAGEAGVVLSEAELSDWMKRLPVRLVQENLAGKVAEIVPPPAEFPARVEAALPRLRRLSTELTQLDQDVRDCPAVFRGYSLADLSSWWPIFFYRFVHPEERMGDHLNYAGRVRRSRALVLPSSWVVLEDR